MTLSDTAATICPVARAGRRVADGILLRHRAGCPADARPDARCRCRPVYRASVWIADPLQPGQGRKVSRTFGVLEEAKAWRASQTGPGRARVAPGRAPTLRTATRELLEGMRSGAIRKRGGGVYRPGVIRSYERSSKRVLEILGDRRLDRITQPDLLELVERLQADGLSPSSIKNALDPVRVVYRRAVARGAAPMNPTIGLELPSGEKPRERVADPSEAGRLVAALPRADDRALWAVALFCGLRAGELRALRWRHVDLAAGS